MQIADDQIRLSIEELWTTTLGLAITLESPTTVRDLALGRLPFTGCVQITGEWEGSLTINCTRRLARQITATLFAIAPEDVTREQVQDALGELTNILSGQFKTHLPRSCRLSLPAVLDGLDHPFKSLDDKILIRLAFTCGDEPLLVTILEGTR